MTLLDRTQPRQPARGRYLLTALAVVAPFWGATATAQTLDDQYSNYLEGKCNNLHFARDENFDLLPGQAGPHLMAYCSGLPIVGGAIETSPTGGAAGAEELSNQGGEEDRALQRRRKRLENDTGPADPADTELANFGATSIFSSLDYQHEHQTSTQYEAGRTSHGFGGLLGVDYRFGTKALAGLALRYQELSGTIETGGNFSTHAPGIRAYASWLPVDGLFIDAAAGFDRRSIDTLRIVGLKVTVFGHGGAGSTSYNPPLTPATSNTHERIEDGALQTGYDFHFGGTALGPRVGLAYSHSVLDPYTESGATPMTLAFDQQTRNSLRTLTGFQVSQTFTARAGVLVPQLNADWVHEYQDNQQLLTARFAEDLRPDPTEFHFLNNPPDRDWFVFRLSTVAVLPHGVGLFVAAEASAGNSLVERYVGSLGVRWEL
jgi:hypothetical protein